MNQMNRILMYCKLLVCSILIANVTLADDTMNYPLNVNEGVVEKKETIRDTPIQLPIITANKRKGTISVYFPETNETYVSSALYGSVVSDKLDMNVYDNPKKRPNHITPAGEFKLTNVFSWRLNEPMLAFIIGKHKIASIHPVWLGNPNQARAKRLVSKTALDNRITNGCINVDPKFYETVLSRVPNDSTLIILPEQ